MPDAEKEALPGGESSPEQDERERRRVRRVLHYFFPFKGPGKEKGSAEEGVGSGGPAGRVVGRGWFCVVPTMQARSEVLGFGWCSRDACRTMLHS